MFFFKEDYEAAGKLLEILFKLNMFVTDIAFLKEYSNFMTNIYTQMNFLNYFVNNKIKNAPTSFGIFYETLINLNSTNVGRIFMYKIK